MKLIKDIRTGDNAWVVFKLPGTSTYTLIKIEISEGFESGWTFIRQNLENSPICFIGKEIYFKDNERDYSESDFIDYKGMKFFTESQKAKEYIKTTSAEESQNIHNQIQNLIKSAYELADSRHAKENLIISNPTNYPIIYNITE